MLKNKVNIICILETKVRESNMDSIMQHSFGGWTIIHNYSYSHLGRIWLLSDASVSLSPIIMGERCVHCSVSIDDTLKCWLIAVYDANTASEGRSLWTSLTDISSMIVGTPWIVTSDFKTSSESSNAEDSSLSGMLDCHDVLGDLSLVDCPWTGLFYTWSYKRSERFITRKLDRVPTNEEWFTQFQGSTVDFLVPLFSEHSPSLTAVIQEQSLPKCSFRFYNFWAQHEDFLSIIARC